MANQTGKTLLLRCVRLRVHCNQGRAGHDGLLQRTHADERLSSQSAPRRWLINWVNVTFVPSAARWCCAPRTGEGIVQCCDAEMEIQQPRQLPSSD